MDEIKNMLNEKIDVCLEDYDSKKISTTETILILTNIKTYKFISEQKYSHISHSPINQ